MSEEYYATEERVEEAVLAVQTLDYPSVAATARAFNVPVRQLQRRVKSGRSLSTRTPTNTRLTPTQEQALTEYVSWLDQVDYQARPKLIVGAANYLLRTATPDAPPVGEHWATRWIARHPEFFKRRQKPLAVARKEAFNIRTIRKHFRDFYDVKQELGIHDDDIYNMDETGFRVGCGKSHEVLTRSARRNLYLNDAEDRDYITSIECINAAGEAIPPLLILKGQHILHKWAKNSLPPDIRICTSGSGYSNDDIMDEWIKHFDEHTRTRTKGLWRLLIIDGYDSHFQSTVFYYAREHQISLFVLPPHSTHWSQPLDVGCFQPFKHWHTEVVDEAVRAGNAAFNRLDFLDAFALMRENTFTKHTIKKAFYKTGLVPFDPEVVIEPLQEQIDSRQSTPEQAEVNEVNFQRTPKRPNHVIKLGKNLQLLIDSDCLYQLPESVQNGLQRFIKAETVMSHTVELLQRDLNQALAVGDRKRKRQSLRSTVASKSGSMTVGQIRSSAAAREEDEVNKARNALFKAKDSLEQKHKKRRVRTQERGEVVETPEPGNFRWIEEQIQCM